MRGTQWNEFSLCDARLCSRIDEIEFIPLSAYNTVCRHLSSHTIFCPSCLEIRRDIIIVANYDAFEYFQLGHFFVNLLLMVVDNFVSVEDAKNFCHFIVSVAVAH